MAAGPKPPAATKITLTGILTTTDANDRLRLILVDILPSQEKDGRRDASWARLKEAVPDSGAGSVPYEFVKGGAPDDAGIRGECWVTVPGGRGAAAVGRRRRILELAADLRGKEVVLEVKPRRFAFVSTARHNRGEQVSGVSLHLVTIEGA